MLALLVLEIVFAFVVEPKCCSYSLFGSHTGSFIVMLFDWNSGLPLELPWLVWFALYFRDMESLSRSIWWFILSFFANSILILCIQESICFLVFRSLSSDSIAKTNRLLSLSWLCLCCVYQSVAAKMAKASNNHNTDNKISNEERPLSCNRIDQLIRLL